MHELSIAMSLVDIASEELARLNGARAHALKVRIGPLSGVVKEALLFSFAMAASGTPVEGARLEFDDAPVTVWCDSCGAERVLQQVTRRRCPICDSPTPEIRCGADLELTGLEVIDP